MSLSLPASAPPQTLMMTDSHKVQPHTGVINKLTHIINTDAGRNVTLLF